MPVILTDVAEFIATVTLNRPARRNALSAELIGDLRRVLTDLDARPDVRVIVLTGADPAFCAGLDLTELGQPDSPLGGVARPPGTRRRPARWPGCSRPGAPAGSP